MVSFDGEWVYYAKFHNLKEGFAPWGGLPVHGADIYKIHVKTRKIVQLTNQQFTPNLGAADWNEKFGGSPSRARTTSPTACSTWGRARCPAASWSS